MQKRNCFWPSRKHLRFLGWISPSAVQRSVLPLVVAHLPVMTRDAALAGLDPDAQEAKKGLWADPHPVPPWEWRKGLLPKGK